MLVLASAQISPAADLKPARYEISTVAGTGQAGYKGDDGPATKAQLNNPYGLTRGPDGALYVCDMANHVISRISRDGAISTVAGTGQRGYAGDGGPARNAQLNEPYEVRFDTAGNMFVVEMQNHLVRRVHVRTQIITTVAGTGKPGFSGDHEAATGAAFAQPHSIQFDRHGALFICDIGNHRLRKLDLGTGMITTFSGTGERKPTPDGAPISGAPLNGPRALDFDREGNLWLALREGNAIYRFDTKAGTVHHVAGTGKQGFTGNGGPARLATLSGPKGLSLGSDGNVYFADTESHTIRMIDVKRGTMELVAGTGERGDGPEGDALACKLARPHGVFVDADGAVYIGDSENHRVRVIRRRSSDKP
ncbi:MAG: hypothetical protein L0Z50_07230 [Verrucomicrobiales bacterium]|nr:hypothetical protein [Verrucomicrobiales bacterium]